MDPIFKFPASPGTPLFPVSPERVNRQLPQSPSLPSMHHDPFATHSRGNSDVQGKVAQFNNLSKEAAQRRKENEAALKRAVLGREEAESEARRLKEEHRVMRVDMEEGRVRERRVCERMEGIMVGWFVVERPSADRHYRKSYSAQRKHMRIRNRFTRKRFAAREKKLSNRLVHW